VLRLLTYFSVFCLFGISSIQAQKTDTNKKENQELQIENAKAEQVSDSVLVLKPAKAAFYSALLPGLGQAYNKKYWKIPIVYAALGTGSYFIITNNNFYNDFRNEYKRRILTGVIDQSDPVFGRLTTETISRAQRLYQRQRDLSILITAGIYILNIIDANVDAHLMQFNVNDNLSLQPKITPNPFSNKQDYGVSLVFQF
jgi:Family of unknown function (DUF5683)